MKRIVSILLALVMVLSLVTSSQNQAMANTKSAESAASQEISWDLSAIYPDKAAFEKEFTQLEALNETIVELRGKLNTVDGVVGYYEGFNEANRLAGRLNAYTELQVQKDQSDSKAKELAGRVSNLLAKISNDMAFALPELFANSDSFLDKVAADARMKPYLTWFDRDRAESKHTLPEAEEQLLQPLYQLQDGAYYLYNALVGSDLTFPDIEFPDGTKRPADEINYSAAFNSEYTQEFRVAYSNAMLTTYSQFRNTLAQNLQNYYTAAIQSAAKHKYGSALEADLAPEDTPMSVYDGVLSSMDQAKPALNRYFDLIKNFLGVKTLYSFETNASIAKDPGTVFSYEEAQKLVKKALAPLGSEYAKKIDTMFSSNAIDVYPGENKTNGCFARLVPGTHPFILLNYTDDFYSVSALSHELGHAVHMQYSQTQESIYGQNVTSLTSEVTSTLNELLLSDYMIKNAKSVEEQQYYTAQQLTLLYNSFYTQAYFARFQEEAVKVVENGGTLTADKLGELWKQAAQDCLGDAYTITEAGADGWARIPHFYSGFYVYQYAVGVAAACNIADRIQSGDQGAVEDYLAFLKAGDSANVVDLLKIAGVDIENGDYIGAFNTRFDRLVTKFEADSVSGTPTLTMDQATKVNSVAHLLESYKTITYAQLDYIGGNTIHATYFKDENGNYCSTGDDSGYTDYLTDGFAFYREKGESTYYLSASKYAMVRDTVFLVSDSEFTSQTTDLSGNLVCETVADIDQEYADALSESWPVTTKDKMVTTTVFAADDHRVLSIDFTIRHPDKTELKIASGVLLYNKGVNYTDAVQDYLDKSKVTVTVILADGSVRKAYIPKGECFTWSCDDGYALYTDKNGKNLLPEKSEPVKSDLTLYTLTK